MAEFCTCGSLKLVGNCTNRKCENHVKGIEPATFKQEEYIKDLCEKLGREYDYAELTKSEASKIIQELEGCASKRFFSNDLH